MSTVRMWANRNRENIRDWLNVGLTFLLVVVLVIVISLSVLVQRRNTTINRIDHASKVTQQASEEVATFVRELKAQQQTDAETRGEQGASNEAIAAGLATIQNMEAQLQELIALVKENG